MANCAYCKEPLKDYNWGLKPVTVAGETSIIQVCGDCLVPDTKESEK